MNEKINFTKADGTSVQVDLICFLEVVASARRFVFYTLNEVIGTDANATVKIYVAKVKQDNAVLDTPITPEEWQLFTKTVMKSTIQGVPCNEIKYVPMTELSNPVSVGEKAIAMPVFHDYISKQRGLYAQNVAVVENTLASQGTGAVTPAVPGPQEPQVQPVTEVPPQAPDTMTAQTTAETLPQEPVVEESVADANAPVGAETSFEVSGTGNIFDQPAAPFVAPTAVEPTPAATTSATLEPQDTLSAQGTDTGFVGTIDNGTAAVLEPIDVSSIEAKYDEMIANLNKLKVQELEAANRYNATIQLSAMHKEQHANYVQSEQGKEASEPNGSAPLMADATIAPANPIPVAEPQESVVASPAMPNEPTPVTPVVPEPVPVSPANLETNWFDMPNGQ